MSTSIMPATCWIILSLAYLITLCRCSWLKYDHPEDSYMYYISETDGDSFLNAQKKCEEKGGSLASITNEEAKNLIIEHYPDANRCYWIGLSQYIRNDENDIVNCCDSGTSEYSYGDIDSFQWIDGSPRTWTYWAEDDLDWDKREPKCVVSCYDDVLHDTQWHIRNCGNTNRYICKVRNDACNALHVTNTIGEVFHGMYQTLPLPLPIQCECCTVDNDNFQRPVYVRYASDGSTHSSYLYFVKDGDSDQWRVTNKLCPHSNVYDAIYVHSDMPYVDMMSNVDAYELIRNSSKWLKSNVTFSCAALPATTTLITSTVSSDQSGVSVTKQSGMTPIYQIVLGVTAMVLAIAGYIIGVVIYTKKSKKKGWKGCCRSSKNKDEVNASFENVYYEVESVPGSSRATTPDPHKTAANQILNKLHSINKLSISLLTSSASGIQVVQPRAGSASTVSYTSNGTRTTEGSVDQIEPNAYENIDKTDYLAEPDSGSRTITVDLHQKPVTPIYDVPLSPTDRVSLFSANSKTSSLNKSASFSNHPRDRALPEIPRHLAAEVAKTGITHSPSVPSDIPNIFGKHPALRATTSSPTISSKSKASGITIGSLQSHPLFKSKSEIVNDQEFEHDLPESKSNDTGNSSNDNEHTYVNAQDSKIIANDSNKKDIPVKSSVPIKPLTAAGSRPVTAAGRPITAGGRPVTSHPRGRSGSPAKHTGNGVNKDPSLTRPRPVTSSSNTKSDTSSKTNGSKPKQKDSQKKSNISKVDQEFSAKNPYKVSQIAPMGANKNKNKLSSQGKNKNGTLSEVVVS